jgi:hypothetical protein
MHQVTHLEKSSLLMSDSQSLSHETIFDNIVRNNHLIQVESFEDIQLNKSTIFIKYVFVSVNVTGVYQQYTIRNKHFNNLLVINQLTSFFNKDYFFVF